MQLTELVNAALRLQQDWKLQGHEFCFIGGLAVQAWGEPRNTSDVDATIWTSFGNEKPVIDQLLQGLQPRITDAGKFALINRVLLVQDSFGVNIDVSMAGLPFEKALIARSELISFGPGIELKICGPSDLIVLKAFANRPRDWEDIRGILIRSAEKLDWQLIESDLGMLSELKEEPEILARLKSLKQSG